MSNKTLDNNTEEFYKNGFANSCLKIALHHLMQFVEDQYDSGKRPVPYHIKSAIESLVEGLKVSSKES